jgi:DNA-binding GntR family transcriptional regulator
VVDTSLVLWWYASMPADITLDRDRAYLQLRELILAGGVSVEQPLSERSLADILGIGRTPVREAIRELARDGLLDVIPARGTFLKQLSLEELRELYELRFALEGMAAFLAAQREGGQSLSAFRRRFDNLLQQGARAGLKRTQDVGWEFHLEIFRAAHNRRLCRLYDTLQSQVIMVMRITLDHDHERVWATIEEHLAILDAIEARDPLAAQQAMCNHLRHALESRARIYQRLQDYGSAGIPQSYAGSEG